MHEICYLNICKFDSIISFKQNHRMETVQLFFYTGIKKKQRFKNNKVSKLIHPRIYARGLRGFEALNLTLTQFIFLPRGTD